MPGAIFAVISAVSKERNKHALPPKFQMSTCSAISSVASMLGYALELCRVQERLQLILHAYLKSGHSAAIIFEAGTRLVRAEQSDACLKCSIRANLADFGTPQVLSGTAVSDADL